MKESPPFISEREKGERGLITTFCWHRKLNPFPLQESASGTDERGRGEEGRGALLISIIDVQQCIRCMYLKGYYYLASFSIFAAACLDVSLADLSLLPGRKGGKDAIRKPLFAFASPLCTYTVLSSPSPSPYPVSSR